MKIVDFLHNFHNLFLKSGPVSGSWRVVLSIILQKLFTLGGGASEAIGSSDSQ